MIHENVEIIPTPQKNKFQSNFQDRIQIKSIDIISHKLYFAFKIIPCNNTAMSTFSTSKSQSGCYSGTSLNALINAVLGSTEFHQIT